MRRLILLRHGQAQRSASSGRDFDRALTSKGERDAREAGAAIARLNLRPEVALVSPALRTRQTFELASMALGEVEMRIDKALLHTDAATILKAAEAAGAETVLAVGHNPGFADLVVTLSLEAGEGAERQAFMATGFPPASVAVFSKTDEGGWTFDAFLPSKDAP